MECKDLISTLLPILDEFSMRVYFRDNKIAAQQHEDLSPLLPCSCKCHLESRIAGWRSRFFLFSFLSTDSNSLSGYFMGTINCDSDGIRCHPAHEYNKLRLEQGGEEGFI